MCSGEGLAGRNPDQSSQGCQFRRQPKGSDPPLVRIAAQRRVRRGSGQQGLAQLLVGDPPQAAIPQHRIDRIGRCCDGRRHALEAHKIS